MNGWPRARRGPGRPDLDPLCDLERWPPSAGGGQWEAVTGGLLVEGYGMTETHRWRSATRRHRPAGRARRVAVPSPSPRRRAGGPEPRVDQGSRWLWCADPRSSRATGTAGRDRPGAAAGGWVRTGDSSARMPTALSGSSTGSRVIITGGSTSTRRGRGSPARAAGGEDAAVVGIHDPTPARVVAAVVAMPGTTVYRTRWCLCARPPGRLQGAARVVVVDELPRSRSARCCAARSASSSPSRSLILGNASGAVHDE